MASNYWIKLYHEMIDDPKIGRLSDSQFRLAINLFLLAGDYEQDGYLPNIEDIRWRLREPQTFDNDIEVLKQYDILTEEDGVLLITKFAERQAAMTAEERSRRRRERDRKKDYYGNESSTKSARKAHESGLDKDIDKKRRDKDVDVDKDTSSPPFISEFVNAVRVKFTNNNQAQMIDDLVEDYGEEAVLGAAMWYGSQTPSNMGHALKSIDTALRRGWNTNKNNTYENSLKVLEEYGNTTSNNAAA